MQPSKTDRTGTRRASALLSIITVSLFLAGFLAGFPGAEVDAHQDDYDGFRKPGLRQRLALRPRQRRLAGSGNQKFWQGSGKMSTNHIISEGVERTYLVYTPARQLTYPAPVVLAFHGGGGSARSMDKFCGGITVCADKEGFIIVFPEGLSKSWNDGRAVNRKHGYDDVLFITSMCDKLIADGVADRRRIYATGISNGGFFSQYLALKIPERIAAVASVAATLADLHESMMTGKPVPLMYILGMDDPLVPFSGGKIGGKILRNSRGNAIPAARAIDFWVNNNGVANSNGVQKVFDTAPGDGTKVHYREYGATGSPNQVVVYEIEGGGHTWPGGGQYLPVALVGKTSKEIDANQVIWDFFNTHKRQ